MSRIWLAFLCFFRVLLGKPLPAQLLPPLPAPPPRPELPPAPTPIAAPRADAAPGALLLLGMFQREGRLVDFLCEPIDGFDDATVGVAARDIHRGLKKVLDDHFTVEPVMPGAENDTVSIGNDFDPGRIRLVGNVQGNPPFRGVLRHHGWRATRVTLPRLAEGIDPAVVAPAEIELS